MTTYQPRCSYCNKFVPYGADYYVPYGCANPEAPEPYDPSFLCKKHADEVYREFKKSFRNGDRSGDWTKSEAEMRAAKECGLAWVGSNGVGILGDKNGNWKEAHQYISTIEYDRLKALPYWGYCKNCGAENKSGACSKSCTLTPHYL